MTTDGSNLTDPATPEPAKPVEWFALAYEELRRRAASFMRGERADHTFTPTVLLNELFIKLHRPAGTGAGGTPALSRSEFLRLASAAMRNLLTDHARARDTQKRLGGRARVDFSTLDALPYARDPAGVAEFLALDEAVSRLEEVDARAAAVVRLRYLAGLTVDEAAAALGVSPRAVKRDWQFARAWLFRELGPREGLA